MALQGAKLNELLKDQPTYRLKQIEKAWFDVNLNSYSEITTLPSELRESLKDIPWLSVKQHTLLTSKNDNTRKLLLELEDGRFIETVLMGRVDRKKNQDLTLNPLLEGEGDDGSFSSKEKVGMRSGDRYTICVSSQVGCPMKCAFCATGKAGFTRNLGVEEIVDQYRFCQRLLAKENARVSNIVLMGQGEPLLNYENVKRALNVILKNTDLGETKITVSTAGVVPVMEQMLSDKDFPKVRWAISLHSAVETTRKSIMPSHKPGFLEFLVKWSKDYQKAVPSRTHFIGLEYIMLGGVNDKDEDLKALIKLGKKMPHIRINLIPYNTTETGSDGKIIFNRTDPAKIDSWHEALMAAGFTSTIRYSQGQDIAAACGQLANKAK